MANPISIAERKRNADRTIRFNALMIQGGLELAGPRTIEPQALIWRARESFRCARLLFPIRIAKAEGKAL